MNSNQIHKQHIKPNIFSDYHMCSHSSDTCARVSMGKTQQACAVNNIKAKGYCLLAEKNVAETLWTARCHTRTNKEQLRKKNNLISNKLIIVKLPRGKDNKTDISRVSSLSEWIQKLWVVCVYIRGGGAVPLLGKWWFEHIVYMNTGTCWILVEEEAFIGSLV